MDTADVPLTHHIHPHTHLPPPPPTHLPLPNPLRSLQPAALSALHQHHAPHASLHHHNAGLPPHLGAGLDPTDPNLFRTGYGHEVALNAGTGLGFEHGSLPHLQQHGLSAAFAQQHGGSSYGLGGAGTHIGRLGNSGREQVVGPVAGIGQDGDTGGFGGMGGEGGAGGEEQVVDAPVKEGGQFEGLKLIPNPEDLEYWRQKLFDVDDVLVLTEEQYVKLPFFKITLRNMNRKIVVPENIC